MDSMTDAQYLNPSQNGYGAAPTLDPSTDPVPEAQPQAPTAPPAQNVDQDIINMVMGRFEASKKWREQYRLEWDVATNHYEMVYDSTAKEDWQATTFQPMIPTHVERATAALHNMSMGPEAPVEYQTRTTENEQRVDSTNELIQHDLERCDFKVHWTDFLRTISLYGTGIAKVEYAKETATVMVKERKRSMFAGMMGMFSKMFGGQQAPAEQESFRPETCVIKDFATFKNVDLYSIYPQPHTEDFSKDNWVIEKDRISNKELVEGAMLDDEFYRLDGVTPDILMSGQPRINSDAETQEKRMVQMDTDVPMPYMDPDLEHERFQYYGPVPKWMIDPSLREDQVEKYLTVNAWIWVIDGRWVVRKKLSPYRDAEPPFVKGNFIRRSGQFYGIGIGKLLAGLQIEKNEIRNTRQDNINIMLQKVVAFLKDKIDKEDIQRLVSAPGALWAFTGIDDIRKAFSPVEFPDVTQDSWRGSAEVDREAQEATDVIKTTQTIGAGEDQAGNGTFRGQMLNRQQSNERFTLTGRILDIMGLNKAIQKMYCRIYQFKKFEQIEQILGKARAQNFELIAPEELPALAKMVSLGALTNENKGLKLAQMRDQWVLFAQEPWFKKLEYARIMVRLGGAVSDPDAVIWTDDEVKQYNEQKRQMMATMGGLPGQEGGQDQPGMPMNGQGSPPPDQNGTNPIAGPNHMPMPSQPPQGPGVGQMDFAGRPAA
jgi:hypothetical protein